MNCGGSIGTQGWSDSKTCILNWCGLLKPSLLGVCIPLVAAVTTSVNTARPLVCRPAHSLPGCWLICAYFFIKVGILYSQPHSVFRGALSQAACSYSPREAAACL